MIQSTAGIAASDGATTVSVAFASDVVLGHAIIVCFGWYNSNDAPIVTDDLGNAYSLCVTNQGAGGRVNIAIYAAKVTTGGPCTVTASVAGGWLNMTISESADVDGLTVEATDAAAGLTGSLTTTTDNALVVHAVEGFHSIMVFSGNAPFTLDTQADLRDAIASTSLVLTPAGLVSDTINVIIGGADNAQSAMVAFTHVAIDAPAHRRLMMGVGS